METVQEPKKIEHKERKLGDDSIVSLSQVFKKFQIAKNELSILKNINVKISPEKFTVIYGPSGSGKSTLLNTILGLEQPTHGKVLIDGVDVFSLTDDQRAEFRNVTFGVVYQQSFWIKTLSVIDNVSLPLLIGGATTSYANARAEYALEEVGMEKFSKRMPVQLSGGQQQRISVARALVTDPKLIVADEPTGNLDSKAADNLITLFRDLISRFNRTVVMVTHELRFLEFADYAFAINDGYVQKKYDKEGLKEIVKNIHNIEI